MKSKLFSVITIAIIAILLYLIYPIIKNRYFNNKSQTIKNESSEQKLSPENNSQTGTQELQKQKNEAIAENSFLKITINPSDCDNECSNFKKEEELRYCQEICGLLSPIKDTSLNCEDKQGLQKDYCLKDLAIRNNDFKACEQIHDEGIKKTCKNRITEDMLDKEAFPN